jgi:hypothetical protein
VRQKDAFVVKQGGKTPRKNAACATTTYAGGWREKFNHEECARNLLIKPKKKFNK